MWTKDPGREARLTKMGFSVVFKRGVSIDEIAVEESRKNNARLDDPYNEDLVEWYAVAMEAGDEFPAVILLVRPRRRMLVLAGNHRLGAAMLCGETSVDAYIVDHDDSQAVDILIRTDNRKESMAGQRQDEALHHILYLIDKYSMSTPEVLEMFGVRDKWFQTARRTHDVRVALAAARVKVSDGVAGTVLRTMCRLLGNTKVLTATARLILGKGLIAAQANEIAIDVKAQDGEKAALACVRKWEDHYDELEAQSTLKRSSVKKPLRKKTMTALGIFERLIAGKNGNTRQSLTQLQLTDDADILDFRKRWKVVSATINKMLREVK